MKNLEIGTYLTLPAKFRCTCGFRLELYLMPKAWLRTPKVCDETVFISCGGDMHGWEPPHMLSHTEWEPIREKVVAWAEANVKGKVG